jgi:NADH dehydrogenase (ubiquinone) 1 alpha/beta subcomplex 1
MFRSAIVRSLKASAPRVIKTPAPFHIRSSPIAAQVPRFTPCFAQGVRLYSAPAGLSKTEAEGRIVNLLKNFDKVRHVVSRGISRYIGNTRKSKF